MAKRIKVKGNPPRGLSKATRQIDAAQEALDRSGVHMSVRSPKRSDAELAKIAGLGRGITKPSSTRKKRVKEGNRKFIGPRTRASVESEKADRNRWSEIETRHQAERGERKIRVPEAVELLREGFFYNPGVVPSGPQWGKGGIAKNNRLLGLLLRRLEKAKNKRA